MCPIGSEIHPSLEAAVDNILSVHMRKLIELPGAGMVRPDAFVAQRQHENLQGSSPDEGPQKEASDVVNAVKLP
jgi:hypothetical protein